MVNDGIDKTRYTAVEQPWSSGVYGTVVYLRFILSRGKLRRRFDAPFHRRKASSRDGIRRPPIYEQGEARTRSSLGWTDKEKVINHSNNKGRRSSE